MNSRPIDSQTNARLLRALAMLKDLGIWRDHEDLAIELGTTPERCRLFLDGITTATTYMYSCAVFRFFLNPDYLHGIDPKNPFLKVPRRHGFTSIMTGVEAKGPAYALEHAICSLAIERRIDKEFLIDYYWFWPGTINAALDRLQQWGLIRVDDNGRIEYIGATAAIQHRGLVA